MSKTFSRRLAESYSEGKHQHNNRKNTRGRKIQGIPVKDDTGFPTKRVKYIYHE